MANVLVVDDEKSYRRYVSARLVREGHDVQVAASGDECIALATATRPEVLVVDWLLGQEGSGLRVGKELQRRDPTLRIILITGFSQDALTSEDDVSVFRCIEKPFEIDELVNAVHDALKA